MDAVDTTALARRIAEARKAAQISNVAEFARSVGVQPGTVYRWENGTLVPSAQNLPAIARACGVTVDWLLTGDEPHGDDE